MLLSISNFNNQYNLSPVIDAKTMNNFLVHTSKNLNIVLW